MRMIRTAAMGVAAALVLAACAPTGSGTGADPAEGVYTNEWNAQGLKRNEPVYGGSLKVGLSAAVESIDPTDSAVSAAMIMHAIYDVLFTLDNDGNLVPELAESLETPDQGKTWIIGLPTGVKFHDGTDFNADAVVQHLNRIAAEGSRSRASSNIRAAESIVATDAATVTITLKEPSLTWPKVFGTRTTMGVSMIPSPASVEQYGSQIGFHPVGVGPFMLESYTSGGTAVVVKNPDYRIEGKPYLDRIEFVQATDTQTRLAAVISGDLDLAPTQAATDLVDATAAGLVSVTQPVYAYWNLLFNLAKPPFDDRRFREAVIRAIDTNAVNQAVFDGLQEPTDGIFPPTHRFYKDVDWPTYDLDKAKDLVAEWSKDTGLKPEFSITTTSPPEFQKQAAIMQQMLAEAGIDMKITVGDQPTMVSEALSGNYTAQHRLAETALETDTSIRQLYYTTSAANNGQAGDPEIDRLLDEAAATDDIAERTRIFGEMQERFVEWLPIMPVLMLAGGWYLGDKVGHFPGVVAGDERPDFRELWIAE